MTVCLRDGVHLAWSGDLAIFLDLNADRYSCLGPAHSALLQRRLSDKEAALGDRGNGSWSRVLIALVNAGLVESGEGHVVDRENLIPKSLARAARSVAPSDKASPFEAVSMLWARTVARRRLRQKPLHALVADQQAWSARAIGRSSAPETRMIGVARVFSTTAY